jgi:hypothetical protein
MQHAPRSDAIGEKTPSQTILPALSRRHQRVAQSPFPPSEFPSSQGMSSRREVMCSVCAGKNTWLYDRIWYIVLLVADIL